MPSYSFVTCGLPNGILLKFFKKMCWISIVEQQVKPLPVMQASHLRAGLYPAAPQRIQLPVSGLIDLDVSLCASISPSL